VNERHHGFFGAPSRALEALRHAVHDAGTEPRIGPRGFVLDAAWGARADAPRRIAAMLVSTAHRLQALDRRLDLVFRDRAYVCSGATETVLDCAREHSVERMLRRLSAASRDGVPPSPGPIAPRLGAGVSLKAQFDGAAPATPVCIRAGHHAGPDASNEVRIALASDHFLLPDRPLATEVMAVLIEIWQPEVAGLYSESVGVEAARRWWLAWKRDGFDPHRAALRRGWPGAMPGFGEPRLGGQLWEWPSHAPAAVLAAG
jgi:hypothetical protein